MGRKDVGTGGVSEARRPGSALWVGMSRPGVGTFFLPNNQCELLYLVKQFINSPSCLGRARPKDVSGPYGQWARWSPTLVWVMCVFIFRRVTFFQVKEPGEIFTKIRGKTVLKGAASRGCCSPWGGGGRGWRVWVCVPDTGAQAITSQQLTGADAPSPAGPRTQGDTG